MKAKIVVGLGLGDEGKGITTDYLASKLKDSVAVRYTGGHQAGHTVVKDGRTHVFASFGSGTLEGIPTYIAEYCCLYLPYLLNEWRTLEHNGVIPRLAIHPLVKLTTPYDIAFNRIREQRLGHGSVGVGIGTTMHRDKGPNKMHAVDTLYKHTLALKLEQIRKYYDAQLYEFNAKEMKQYMEMVKIELKLFNHALDALGLHISSYNYLNQFQHVIFEGAQGILLDMDFGVFPNVTYGYTTSRNAIAICNLLGISEIDMYYVTRCYLTRHGNGWLPNDIPVELVNNGQETNVLNDWQGEFKVRELDYELLNYALECDDTYSYGHDKHLVVTCLDQRPDYVFQVENLRKHFISIHYSYSPDSKNFKTHSNV